VTLAAGSRLGPYEIVAPLGAGGMGEVYRARDPRLGRDVAVKVLPASLSNDPDRQRRFEQEARAAGVLNHPNITAVYDVGSSEGSLYVVSELLDGETLGSLLATGPISVRKAVDYALQIAHGLSAAHEKGIVHRDLKPDNLFVTRGGRVKILDFGLAKLGEAARESDGAGHPNSLTSAGTEPGVILGTLGYMSPEQVRGRPADARSDIFSFGAILYEMLSGRPAFPGSTPADTISAILKEDPPELAETSRPIPPALERVIRHCVEKNPEERFRSAHDLAFALEAVSGSSVSSPMALPVLTPSASARRLPLAVLVALAGVVVGLLLDRRLRPPAVPQVVSFRPLTYSGRDLSPAASPDGRTIAFASERDGRRRIWLKQLAADSEVALTSGQDDYPRFSPDGSMVLFLRSQGARLALFRVPLLGGEPRKLVEDASDGDWSPDGRQIVFLRSSLEQGLSVSSIFVAASDGSGARRIARFPGQAFRWPRWSPDGRTIAVVDSGLAGGTRRIRLVDVASGRSRAISPPDNRPAVSAAWSGNGQELVYSLAIRGGGVRVVRHDVDVDRGQTILSLPANSGIVDVLSPGRLIFDTVSARENLRELSIGSAPADDHRWLTRGNSAERQPAYSPDGEWVVFTSSRSGNLDLWALSLKTGAVRRLTEDETEDWDPALVDGGRKLLWSSGRGGHLEIWIAEADGSGSRKVTNDGMDAQNPTATPRAEWIVYNSGNPSKTGVWKIRADGTAATRLVAGTIGLPEVSPDGQYVSYLTGVQENRETIRVVRLADGAPVPFEISIEIVKPGPVRIGRSRWMPDGRAIAFVGQDEKGVYGIFAQDFVPGRDTTSTRRALGGFDGETETESFGISPDGSRMMIASWERLFTVMEAEGVSGITPPSRSAK
jgi:eukaryotic-like serine/threonine-protein kinase